MALTTEGLKYLSQAAIGQGTPFNNANARIGVGDGDTAFSVSHTNLLGTNRARKGMDQGYPTIEAPVVTFRSTFAPNEANFAWNEWGIFNAASGGVMLNRVVENLGTKQSGQTWVLEVAITLTLG